MQLQHEFADTLPELAQPWRAQEMPNAELLVLNESLAEELGLDVAWLRGPEGLSWLTGQTVPEGGQPVAQIYSGHQFGWYAPRLGDGRALLLGELIDRDGQRRDVHLKGSGKTPFARRGDGQAVLGPMLREFLMSEAMYALGVPTTRALAVVATGHIVQRDFPERGALLVRVASSHLRVGSFQYARSLDEPEALRRLVDFAIERHSPAAADAEVPVLALYREVIARQARLIADWMRLGFVHGVMNTDNVTISGETIDYGPCAFLDAYDPALWFSSIDEHGRYAFANQPAIAEWDLARLGEALLPLVGEGEEAVALVTAELQQFAPQYQRAWLAGMRDKLGLSADLSDPQVDALASATLRLLQEEHIDYTEFFRALVTAATGDDAAVERLFADASDVRPWLQRWRELTPDAELIARSNPAYIPRNHLVEEALAAAGRGDLAPFGELLEVVTEPYAERPGGERFATAAPASFGPYVTYCGT
ncbi:protein adenylyltransferase SelO [Gulosibacter sediminis]|uniref:protein adenylyltransferase SelO n=1 Tax=Gulosibacter sediminis TaxID=1729695 RepID=UPI0018680868|nr:YdiU family protein [Gulosibacter sediminis]